jgi:hypothetical protein
VSSLLFPNAEDHFFLLQKLINVIASDPSLAGANPTIASYDASVVKIYSATNSMGCFYNENYFALM